VRHGFCRRKWHSFRSPSEWMRWCARFVRCWIRNRAAHFTPGNARQRSGSLLDDNQSFEKEKPKRRSRRTPNQARTASFLECGENRRFGFSFFAGVRACALGNCQPHHGLPYRRHELGPAEWLVQNLVGPRYNGRLQHVRCAVVTACAHGDIFTCGNSRRSSRITSSPLQPGMSISHRIDRHPHGRPSRQCQRRRRLR